MKKLLFLLLMAAATMVLPQTEVKAQTKMIGTNDTSLAAGTTYYTSKVLGKYSTVGTSGLFKKTSGTVSGYAWLEGTVDGTTYFAISDSITIANNTNDQKKKVNFTKETHTLFKIRWAVANIGGAFTAKCWYLGF